MLQIPGCDFSYGEQRIMSLVRLFLGNYSLYLLDEPTAGVNPIYFNVIKELIQQMICNGKTVLMIEHNMHFVREVARECAFMDSGKIRFQGSVEEILENKEV